MRMVSVKNSSYSFRCKNNCVPVNRERERGRERQRESAEWNCFDQFCYVIDTHS